MVQKHVRNHAMRGNHHHYARMTHPHPHRHVVPTTVLTRSRLVPLTVARPVTIVVPQTNVQHQRPAKHVVNKPHSPIRRLINHESPPKNSNFLKKVTTVKPKQGNPQQALKDKGVIESGCSRHMTGNISYPFKFKEINGGYVVFGRNPKGGKIIGKGKISTGKLDFDDVYFVKELKLNLFSVSQMCEKKNSVIFTDTECVGLSSDFKLPNENHVLLMVPKENNMIKREFSIARTPQQNGIAERKNRTLIEAARTMLAYSLLPILFWVVAVNTACYIQNKVLLTKPHNMTPYELLLGRTPSIGFMRPFGCPVTILNTLDPLEKFDGKADEGFLVGYSSMNYQPVVVGNQPNCSAGIQDNFDAGKVCKEPVSSLQYVLLPLWSTRCKDPHNKDYDAAFDVKENEYAVLVSPSSRDTPKKHDEKTKKEAKGNSPVELSTGVSDLSDEFEEFSNNSTTGINAASTPITAVRPNLTNSTTSFSAAGPSNTAVSPTFEIYGNSSFVDPSQYPDDPNMPALEDITYLNDEEDVGAAANFSNLETNIIVSPIPTTRVHKDHPVTQIFGDLSSAPQTRSMEKMVKEQGGLTQINDADF
nr:ribonuclease H-like domain-containing protein [Tanacetum cinerariifolium]